MNMKKLFSAGALIFAFGAMTSYVMAADKTDKIDADDFVEEASAKGLAEIESSKLALSKSTSTDIKAFAQKMITDHSATNTELAAIAARKNIEVAEEAELMSKAKKFILEQRDGESFDEAYAKNQVAAHEMTIELFERASISDDADIAAFAKKTLPALQHHLKMARELEAAHDDE